MKFTFCLVIVLLAVPALAVVTVSPIGDSLTNGVGSTNNGGYRYFVKQAFGNSIDFLGRRNDGNFQDNQNEGWGGFKINTIRTDTLPGIASGQGFGQIVLLMAGTNDFWSPLPNTTIQQRVDTAISDMHNLISAVTTLTPNSMIMVGSIPRSLSYDHSYDYPEIPQYNAALASLISSLNNTRLRFVDTGGALNLGSDRDPNNGHPTDSGYQKIALAWDAALATVLPERQIPVASDTARIMAVPEPSSVMLLAATPLFVAMRRRRR